MKLWHRALWKVCVSGYQHWNKHSAGNHPDGINGHLIEPDNSSALMENILRLEGDRELLTRMSLAARQRYLDQPPWDENAGGIRDF
jgi:hypothetical protein